MLTVAVKRDMKHPFSTSMVIRRLLKFSRRRRQKNHWHISTAHIFWNTKVSLLQKWRSQRTKTIHTSTRSLITIETTTSTTETTKTARPITKIARSITPITNPHQTCDGCGYGVLFGQRILERMVGFLCFCIVQTLICSFVFHSLLWHILSIVYFPSIVDCSFDYRLSINI